jgi:CTD kinase subunit gamma
MKIESAYALFSHAYLTSPLTLTLQQKRLREQRWILPTPPASAQHRLTSTLPVTLSGNDTAFDKEFDDAWETTSDWNEDDEDAIDEENELCFPGLSFRRE